jgi:hypothetical protein
MHRNLPKQTGAGCDGSLHSEASLFAQTTLGNPNPGIVKLGTVVGENLEHIEWLCQVSSRYLDEFRRLQSAEAQALREREQLEWAAQISDRAADKLRALRYAEFKELEDRERRRRTERFAEMLFEGTWDPSKHPRLGGPPNAGWWASSGSGSATDDAERALTPRAVTTASFSDRNQVVAQQVSWHPPVGHHWVPVGVTQDPDIRPYLSDEAVQYATGAYSGPTDPHHGNTTIDEVTHHRYSAEVRAELHKFIKQHKIKKMTVAQMAEFTSLIENGFGADGRPHAFIGRYNKAIKAMLPKGAIRPNKLDDILAAGRKYMKHSRFRLLAAGAVVSGILGEVVAQQIKILNVASSSGLYRQALRALQDGDLSKARGLLIGDHDSLYHEILGQVGAHAALDFKATIERVFANAQDREYK